MSPIHSTSDVRALVFLVGPPLLLCACGDEVRHLSYPPGEGAWALLADSPVRSRLWILARDPQTKLEVEVDDPATLTLAAAVFDADTPHMLRLPEGRVELESASALTRGLPLGGEQTRFFLADAASGWREQEAAWPALERLRFRDSWLCPDLEVEVIEIPGTEGADGFSAGVKLSEDAALVRQSDGRIFLIDARGEFEEVSIAGLEGGATAFAVHGDELWVGTSSGGVFRGALARPYAVERFGAPTDSPIDRLVVTASGGREHVMLLDRGRRLWHFDGAAWSVAHAYYADSTSDRSKDLIEIEPGHVLGCSLSEPEIVRFQSGVWTVEVPEDLPISGFSRLLHISGFGTLAVSTLGTIYSDHQGRWEELMTPTARINIGALVELDGPVLTGDLRSGLELVYPSRALACGPRTLPFTIRAELLARLGERVLAAGSGRRQGSLSAFALVRMAYPDWAFLPLPEVY